MDPRIGLDRPSMRTNVLIHARPDVGRARETLIYAPARVRASDVVFGRPAAARDARDAARDALRWPERAPETVDSCGAGAMDLVAMNRAAAATCATSAEVRRFRRDAEDPVARDLFLAAATQLAKAGAAALCVACTEFSLVACHLTDDPPALTPPALDALDVLAAAIRDASLAAPD